MRGVLCFQRSPYTPVFELSWQKLIWAFQTSSSTSKLHIVGLDSRNHIHFSFWFQGSNPPIILHIFSLKCYRSLHMKWDYRTKGLGGGWGWLLNFLAFFLYGVNTHILLDKQIHWVKKRYQNVHGVHKERSSIDLQHWSHSTTLHTTELLLFTRTIDLSL